MKITIYSKNPYFYNNLKTSITTYYKNFKVNIFNDFSFHNYSNIYFIELENDNSRAFTLCQDIRRYSKNSFIIFCSSYEKHILPSFHMHIFDFLKIPVSEVDLLSLINDIISINKINLFNFSFNKEHYTIPLSKIIFFEKSNRKVIVNYIKGNHIFYMKSSDLMDILPSNFIRVHHSFIINKDYILKSSNNYIDVIANNEVVHIPTSRKYFSVLKRN